MFYKFMQGIAAACVVGAVFTLNIGANDVTVHNYQSTISYNTSAVRLSKVSSTTATATFNGSMVQTQVEIVEADDASRCKVCYLWAAVTMPPATNLTFDINDSSNEVSKPSLSAHKPKEILQATGTAVPSQGHVQVAVAKDGQSIMLSNSHVQIRVAGGDAQRIYAEQIYQSSRAAAALVQPPAPLLSIQPRGGAAQSEAEHATATLGGSSWSISNTSTFHSLSVSVDASGPIVGQVTQTFTFTSAVPPSQDGIDGGPAKRGGTTQAVLVWRLEAGDNFARVHSSHNLGDNSSLLFDLSAGFDPRSAVMDAFSYAKTKTTVPTGANQRVSVPLKPDDRLGAVLGYAYPKWTQGADARWSIAATDGKITVAAIAARLGAWDWPIRKSLVLDRVQADLATGLTDNSGRNKLWLHQPMRVGARYFLLYAGDADGATTSAFQSMLMAREQQRLDKMQNEYILEFPSAADSEGGQTVKVESGGDTFSCPFFYDNTATNPTGQLRQYGKHLIEGIQKGQLPPANRATLMAMQCYLDPDWFSGYLHGTSPENANFYTDYVRVPVALSMGLTTHPKFKSDLLPMVKGAFEMDLTHSITLPSGASQEAPGYMNHAFEGWFDEAPLLKKYWGGYDAAKAAGGRLSAAAGFPFQISQPFAWHFLGKAAGDPGSWDGRWMLPTGDTHPDESNLTMIQGLVQSIGYKPPPVQALKTMDVVGFGHMLRDRVGTMDESFVGFKSYPHRGHFHGDQLSIHYCAYGMRLSIDIQAGYKPRPPEESWHSKALVDSSRWTSVNMDGYERALGMSTSSLGDAAVGEVSSNRLRYLPGNPNDNVWQAVWPTRELSDDITYRRTVVLVRGTDQSSAVHSSSSSGLRTYVVLRDQMTFPNGAISNASVTNVFLQMSKQTSRIVNGSIADMGNGTAFTFSPAWNASCDASRSYSLPWGCFTNESSPVQYHFDRWDWPSEGNEFATAARPTFQIGPNQTAVEMYTLLYPGGSLVDGHPAPAMWQVSDESTGGLGIAVATAPDASADILMFYQPGAIGPAFASWSSSSGASAASRSSSDGDSEQFRSSGSKPLVTLTRQGKTTPLLTTADVSYGSSQGEVGPLVLGAGYDFGPIPTDQLAEQLKYQAAYEWPPKSL